MEMARSLRRGPHVSSSRSDETEPVISNARLGFICFLAGESMLFGGLIGAFLVFRFGAVEWPPAGLPRLPVGVTAVNTAILFASCVPMYLALRALRRGDHFSFRRGLTLATALGLTFLAVQGYEWVNMLGHGLEPSSGAYGSTFYTLIGFHGLHVFGAVVWLVVVLAGARRGRYTAAHHTSVELANVYWFYVSGVWAVLFPLVYLGLGAAN